MARHIRKGDQVMVTAGDYKGQTGEVLEVVTKSDRVLVKGVNIRTKHVRPTQLNVSPVVDGKPTRVRFETKTDGSKHRVAVRGGKSLGEIRGAKNK
jgi:large subunit ribosomal protein L24